jgi:SSS family solute:Na+ symporter
MITWFWIFSLIYIGLLIYASTRTYKKKRSIDDFMLAGSNIGALLGILTYAAALFSAFIFMGMPDFYRVHGVGAWIFLAVSDGAMFFFIFWFGYHLRNRARELGFKGMAGMMSRIYGTPWAGYIVFLGAFLFLIPYVAIQIRGISIFFNAIFPELLPSWGWALIIVLIMLAYGIVGGLKAIVFSDAIQALLLLIVLWIIGYNCIQYFGNVENLFDQVEKIDERLLSIPGPQGLFTVQFLLASFVAILLLPATQPQFSTRIVVMKSMRETYRMAAGLAIVSILVFAATAFIGMYGAVRYTSASSRDFISGSLLFDQGNALAALAIVGLFAAVLSTSNAQVFALGSEFRSLIKGDDKSVLLKTRIALAIFTVIVLVFSVIISDQLVLLARVSFTGTSMIAPIILVGILFKKPPGKELIIASAVALFLFLFSLSDYIPDEIRGIRVDLALHGFLVLVVALSLMIRSFKKKSN